MFQTKDFRIQELLDNSKQISFSLDLFHCDFTAIFRLPDFSNRFLFPFEVEEIGITIHTNDNDPKNSNRDME